MIFFKFAGEILQDRDVSEGVYLEILLVVLGIGISVLTLVMLNYLMRDFDQLDCLPIYQSCCFLIPLLLGLYMLDEISMYTTGKLVGIGIASVIMLAGIQVIGLKNGSI